MDLDKVIAELMEERDLLDRAIAQLEKLSIGMRGDSSGALPEPERRQARIRNAGAGGN